MLEGIVIFALDGIDVSIQCSKEGKIKDICLRFANKVQKNRNSLLFLYGGNQLTAKTIQSVNKDTLIERRVHIHFLN